MDIRHLKYVVAVADTLHFGRAALALGISQPPLSARIKEVEDHCGFQLFERTTRKVELTEKGRVFIAEARKVTESFDALMSRFALGPDVPLPAISLGVPSDTSAIALLEIGELFRRAGERVDLRERTTADQLVTIRAGGQTLGAVRLPAPVDDLLVGRTLRRELGAVLPASHPLAGEVAIDLAQLEGEDLVIFPRSMAPQVYEGMLSTFAEEGWHPRRLTHATRLARPMVANGEGILFREKAYAEGVPELVWKPLRGKPLAWRMAIVAGRVQEALFARFHEPLEAAFIAHDNWTQDEAS
jgi:DNA-binding transcriptional LysR family regulator